MKIFVNRKIKRLFFQALLPVLAGAFLSALCTALQPDRGPLWIGLFSTAAAIFIFTVLYRYFLEQNRIMEDAASQIRNYIAGDQRARISCNEEGQLYRLFHEVNSLVSILNAHAENESRSRQFMKDTISDISHQLKTPLAALNVYNGIIQDEAADLDTVREFTALSEQELDRIGTLVQNLLKITRLDAGTLVMQKAPEPVSEMMEDIRRHFAYRASQEGKTLALYGSDGITLVCDRGWLTEAISNIVKNAFDHTEKDGDICLSWRSFASAIQITVSDNGKGIHPEDLPHIFKRFYRSRFSSDTRGIGLGLPLAKAIVEAHSGTIEADSILGAGATFTITFLIPTKL